MTTLQQLHRDLQHHKQEASRLRELAVLHDKIAAAFDAGVDAAWEKVELLYAIPQSCRHPNKRMSKETKAANKHLREVILPRIDEARSKPANRDFYHFDPADPNNDIPF